MQNLKQNHDNFGSRKVKKNSAILLHDLEFGLIIMDLPNDTLGVQVNGEQEMRRVTIDNIYVDGDALVEVLPTYTEDQLYSMFQKMRGMPDPDMVLNIINRLECVGFDIECDDYRTMQDSHEHRIVKNIGHRPSFCAKWGHQWEGDIVRLTCLYCGASKPLPYLAA